MCYNNDVNVSGILIFFSDFQEREKVKLEKERRERERLDAEFIQQLPPQQMHRAHPQHWHLQLQTAAPAGRSAAQPQPPSPASPHHSPHHSPQASQVNAQAQPLPPRQPKPGTNSSPLYNHPPPVSNVRAYPKPTAGACLKSLPGKGWARPGRASGCTSCLCVQRANCCAYFCLFSSRS